MKNYIMFFFIIIFFGAVVQAKNYAIVIGINDYRYFESLKYSEKDADDISELLVKFNYEVKTFKGKEANNRAIEAEIRDVCGKSAKEDNLMIYFSGYASSNPENEKNGIFTYYAGIEETDIYSFEEILQGLNAFKGTKTFFLEGKIQKCKTKNLITKENFETWKDKFDLCILEFVDEELCDKNIKNGPATDCFINGVKGKMMDKDNDGVIVVGEVGEYFEYSEAAMRQNTEIHFSFYRIPLFLIKHNSNPNREITLDNMVCVKGKLYAYDAADKLIDYNLEVGKYEITNRQFAEFLNNIAIHQSGQYCSHQMIMRNDDNCNILFDESNGKRIIKKGKEEYPVTHVTWWGAAEYCNWLSVREGYPITYDWNGNMLNENGEITYNVREVKGYRLPTKEEWEYFAKKGYTGYRICNDIDEYAVFSENSVTEDNVIFMGKGFFEVGVKNPDDIGIFDVYGNVGEWINETYDNENNLKDGIVKGGNWNSREEDLRPDLSVKLKKDEGDVYTGFRICQTKGMIAPEIFAVEVETGAEFDLDGISELYEDSFKESGFVYWARKIDEIDILRKNVLENTLIQGFPKYDELILNYFIYENGKIRISVSSYDIEKALYIFTGFLGLENFKDNYGNYLPDFKYENPLNYYTSNDIVRMNSISGFCSETYKYIYINGLQKSGPDDLHSLYNKKWALINYSKRNVSVLRLCLINLQMDYEWYDERIRKLQLYTNCKWSPVAENPDQTLTIYRSAKFCYYDCTGSFCAFQLCNDNRNTGYINARGIGSKKEFYFENGNIKAYLDQKTSELFLITNDSAAIYKFYENEYPSEINMKLFTDWSVCGAYFNIAVYGDIEYYDVEEIPCRGDDDNPVPFLMRVFPGINSSVSVLE